jgi:hypothetical protein
MGVSTMSDNSMTKESSLWKPLVSSKEPRRINRRVRQMSQQAGQIFAKAGPVVLAATGASVASVSAATIIIATGGAVALALAGYGIYCYLASSRDSAPKEIVNEKINHLYEWSRDGVTVLEKLAFGEILKKAATGEVGPEDLIRPVGESGWTPVINAK